MDSITLSPFAWQGVIEQIADYRTLWRVRAVSRDFRDIADKIIAKKSRFTLDLAMAKRESSCSHLYFRDVGRYCTCADITPLVKSGDFANKFYDKVFRGACCFGRTDIFDLIHELLKLYCFVDFVKYACKYRRISIMSRWFIHIGNTKNICMRLFPPGKNVSADANRAYLAWHHETFSRRDDYAVTIAAYAGKIGDASFLEKNGIKADERLDTLFCINAIEYGHVSAIKHPIDWHDEEWILRSGEVYKSLDRDLIKTFELIHGYSIKNRHGHTLPAAIKRNRQDIIEWILSETETLGDLSDMLFFAAKKRNFTAICAILAKSDPPSTYLHVAALRNILERVEYYGDMFVIGNLNKIISELSATSPEH
ncbi:MAG: hypothetical protein M0R33_17120 [Methylomonas sp.]|uniref:hypothetical protein n=1 Tax=Methylomonas sp. TaxID=418 RepID=UPI0025DD3930|nr:hypothetical protein [Methylomonas sp.]MCK9608168.1 hypothetical protein [Methylomonas sp.]